MQTPIDQLSPPNDMSTSIESDRRGYSLPPFVRTTWATRAAAEDWGPRFKAIGALSKEMSVQAAIHDTSICLLRVVAPFEVYELSQRLSPFGRRVVILGEDWPQAFEVFQPSSHYSTSLVIAAGPPGQLVTLEAAWKNIDLFTVLECVGWPRCCIRKFLSLQGPRPWHDLTWHMASASDCEMADSRTLIAKLPMQYHTLLRPLGITPTDHVPCTMQCEISRGIYETRLQLMETAGFTPEATYLREILAWPVEWSSLHGIAEIKTPICKVSVRSDSVAKKYTVKIPSETYPAIAPYGLGFPFLQPQHLRTSDSKSFQRGLDNEIE